MTNHSLFVICPTLEDKTESFDRQSLISFKEDMMLSLKTSRLRFIVFDHLEVPCLDEFVFGKRVRDNYFTSTGCMRKAGWQQACHQLVCVLKEHSYLLSSGEITREEKRKS